MKKDKKHGFRNRFSQSICKFFNIFTFCSGQSTSYIVKNSSYILATPVIRRTNMYISQTRPVSNHLKLSFYPTTYTSIDQTYEDEPTISSTSSLSSSSPTSNCQSSLTIHQCCSTSTIPSGMTTNIEILNNIIEHQSSSSSSPPQTSSRFSYLIRPSTPCILGREDYDYDDDQMNDDEFFITAGGIVHSCPNIYELSNDNPRKLQSCDHLMFIDQQTTVIDNDNNNLNCYDTEFDRYSILPRFQNLSSSSSISSESLNSELELYKERHAIGFSRNISLLPTTWKSDNYLFIMPLIDHRKRSRSYNIPFE